MYSSNIFPPVFNQSYMPAFIYTDTCRVYFSLSRYNSINSLYHIDSNTVGAVQVSVRDQKTNASVLDSSVYPSGIKLTTLGIDNTKEGDDKYYIVILNEDIQNGFILNAYYKVQIRFTGAGASSPPVSGGINDWLNANINYFSEWSRVVLIRGISYPNITLDDYSLTTVNTIIKTDLDIGGQISFSDQSDSEILRSYIVQLYQNNVLLQSSGQIYSVNNRIDYSIKRSLRIEQSYQVKIQIITQNLYSWPDPVTINFEVEDEIQPPLDIDLQCKADNKFGCIKLLLLNKYNDHNNEKYYDFNNNILTGKSKVLSFTDPEISNFLHTSIMINDDQQILFLANYGSNTEHDLSYGVKIVIKRASSKDDFLNWEQIDNFTITQASVADALWSDFTVESGIWYKYKIIRYNIVGVRTASIEMPYPIMMHSEDIFLSGNDKQFNVRFDPQINNFSYKISESLIETIGSQYPYIRRNGNVNYRSFSLSGTISCFVDLESNLMKAAPADVYNNSRELYFNYNNQNNITLWKDDIYERFFRQKVINFLQENNVKLFRSTTEGNILVKLTNVNFTPNSQLNRQIYSFSCTVNEVAECSIKNYQKYNILKINNVHFNTTERGDVNEE